MLINANSVTIHMRKLTELFSDKTTLFSICVTAGEIGCLIYERYWTNKTCMFPRKRHVDGVSQTGTNGFYLIIWKKKILRKCLNDITHLRPLCSPIWLKLNSMRVESVGGDKTSINILEYECLPTINWYSHTSWHSKLPTINYIEYVHSFVVLCRFMALSSAVIISCDTFTHIPQGYLVSIRHSLCIAPVPFQESNPEGTIDIVH